MINYVVRLVLRIFAIVFPTQKPTLFSGRGSALKLGDLLTASGHRRPLVITEKFALQLGLLDALFASLRAKGCELAVFDGVVPNPTFDVIREGLSICEQARADCVVVVGGGSAIDTGKVIAAGATNGPSVERLAGVRKIKRAPLPMYVVPTTSGTGSEVTNAAVISDSDTHQKKFFVDPTLVPIAAALDPDMLKSLPSHITAATGMDALTHAIESYVSLNPFDDARRDARTAISLIFKYLPIAYKDGQDLEAREMLAILDAAERSRYLSPICTVMPPRSASSTLVEILTLEPAGIWPSSACVADSRASRPSCCAISTASRPSDWPGRPQCCVRKQIFMP